MVTVNRGGATLETDPQLVALLETLIAEVRGLRAATWRAIAGRVGR